MKIIEIQDTEYDLYYGRYIENLLPDTELRVRFKTGCTETLNFFNNIPKLTLDYKYAEGKWSVKEVFQHLIDTERIFAYRCFRIARHDKTVLTNFDQNIYITPSGASQKSIGTLFHEYKTTRDASLSLLFSLSDQDLRNIGSVNNVPMSARAAAAVIIGHDIWHMNIIKERYL